MKLLKKININSEDNVMKNEKLHEIIKPKAVFFEGDDQYDDYEEEIIESDEYYDEEQPEEYYEDYPEEEYGEYDEQEGEYQEEPYQDEYDQQQYDYDQGYDNQYYDDRMQKVLEELADLKKGLAPANGGLPVVPQAPYVYTNNAQGSGSHELVMYNEMSRLREELNKTQSATMLQSEIAKLKDELAREAKEKERENELREEIRNLKSKIDNPQARGAVPHDAGAPKTSVGKDEFNKLISLNEEILKACISGDAKLMAELDKLRKELPSSEESAKLAQKIDSIKNVVKGSSSSASASMSMGDGGALLDELYQLKAELKHIGGGSPESRSVVSVDSQAQDRTTDVMRAVLELRRVIGNSSPAEARRINQYLDIYADLEKLKNELVRDVPDVSVQLNAMFDLQNKLKDVPENELSDVHRDYLRVRGTVLSTPLSADDYPHIQSFNDSHGKKFVPYSKEQSIKKFFELSSRILQEDITSVIDLVQPLIDVKNKIQNNANHDLNEQYYSDILTLNSDLMFAEEEDADHINQEIAEKVDALCTLSLADFLEMPQLTRAKPSKSIQTSSLFDVLSEIKAAFASVELGGGGSGADALVSEIYNLRQDLADADKTEIIINKINEIKEQDEVYALVDTVLAEISDLKDVTVTQDSLNSVIARIDEIQQIVSELGIIDSLDARLSEIDNQLYADREEILTRIEQLQAQEQAVSTEQMTNNLDNLAAEVRENIEVVSNDLNIKLLEIETALNDFVEESRQKLAEVVAILDAESMVVESSAREETTVTILDRISAVDETSVQNQQLLADLRDALDNVLIRIDEIGERDAQEFETTRTAEESSARDMASLREDIVTLIDGSEARISEEIAQARTDFSDELLGLRSDVEAIKQDTATLSEALHAEFTHAIETICAENDTIRSEMAQAREDGIAYEDATATELAYIKDTIDAMRIENQQLLDTVTAESEARQEYADSMHIYKEEATVQIDSIREETLAQFDALREENAAHFDALREESAAQFDVLRQENAAQFDVLRQETAANLDAFREESIAQFDIAREETVAQFDIAREETAAQFDLLRNETNAILETLRAENAQVAADQKAENSEAIEQFKASTQETLDQVRVECQVIGETVQTEFASLRSELEATHLHQEEADAIILDEVKQEIAATQSAILTNFDEWKGENAVSQEMILSQVSDIAGRLALIDNEELKSYLIEQLEGIHEEIAALNSAEDQTRQDALLDEITLLREEMLTRADFEEHREALLAEIFALKEDVLGDKGMHNEHSDSVLAEISALREEILQSRADQEEQRENVLNEIASIKDEIAANDVLDENKETILSELSSLHEEIAQSKLDQEELRDTILAELAQLSEDLQNVQAPQDDLLQEEIENLKMEITQLKESGNIEVLSEITSIRDEITMWREEQSGEQEIILSGEFEVERTQILSELTTIREELSGIKEDTYTSLTSDLEMLTTELSSIKEEIVQLRSQDQNKDVAGEIEKEQALIDRMYALTEEMTVLRDEVTAVKDNLNKRAAAQEVAQGDISDDYQLVLGEIVSLREEVKDFKNDIYEKQENSDNSVVLRGLTDLSARFDEYNKLHEEERAKAEQDAAFESEKDSVVIETLMMLKKQVEDLQQAQRDSEIEREARSRDLFDQLRIQLEELKSTKTEQEQDTTPISVVAQQSEETAFALAEIKDELVALRADNDLVKQFTSAPSDLLYEELSALKSEVSSIKDSLTKRAAAQESAAGAVSDDYSLILSEIFTLREDIERMRDESASRPHTEVAVDADLLGEVLSLREDVAKLSEDVLVRQPHEASAAVSDDVWNEISALREELQNYSQEMQAQTQTEPDTYSELWAEILSLRGDIQKFHEDLSADASATDVNEQLSALRQELETMRAEHSSALISDELSSLRSELYDYKENISAYAAVTLDDEVRTEIQDIKVQIDELYAKNDMQSILSEIASLREATNAINEKIAGELAELRNQTIPLSQELAIIKSVAAEGVEPDYVVLNELLALRQAISTLKEQNEGNFSEEDSLIILEEINKLKDQITQIKDSPDYGVLNEVLALQEELRSIKDELNRPQDLSPVVDRLEELSKVVSDTTDRLSSDEYIEKSSFVNNIILEELTALRNELTALQNGGTLSEIATEIRRITQNLDEKVTAYELEDLKEQLLQDIASIKDEIINISQNHDDAAITKIQQELNKLKEHIEARAETELITQQYISEMAQLIGGHAPSADVSGEISKLKQQLESLKEEEKAEKPEKPEKPAPAPVEVQESTAEDISETLKDLKEELSYLADLVSEESQSQPQEQPKPQPVKKSEPKPQAQPVGDAPRGRGRPRKQVEEAASTEPKRGRGRPRKEVDSNQPTEPKRGRGRPRKS